LAIQNQVSLAHHQQLVGRRFQVLVEGPSKTMLKANGSGPMQLTGRTRTDHIVVFEGNERLIGQTVDVDIEEATAFTLFGTVVTGEQMGVVGNEEMLNQDTRAKPDLSYRIALPLV